MKIVHIITRLAKGGSEENTVMSCLHQARQGHDVYLLFGPNDLQRDRYVRFENDVAFSLIPSLVHPINPLRDLLGLIQLVLELRRIRPDIVHTHISKAGILGRLAAWLAGVPLIIHGVHILPFSNVGKGSKIVYLAAEHFAALFTDLFIHVSNGTRQAYYDAKIGKRKIHTVVYSGMEIEKYDSAEVPENWQEMLRRSPGDPEPKIILMMAALEHRKRQLEFLSGFASATKAGDPIRLLFAGEGRDKQEIEDKIAALGLQDRVILLGHYAHPEKLVALADVGVLSSLREGLPRVVVQYLAGKKPAVVSAVDGIEEIVEDNVDGLIIRTGNAEDVAIAAVNLLNDDEAYARLQQGASAKDVSRWSFESMFEALDKSYDLVIDNKIQDNLAG